MNKSSKNEKLVQSLKTQIDKLEESIKTIESDIKAIEGGLWTGSKASSVINKLNKQMSIDKDLLLSLTEIYNSIK